MLTQEHTQTAREFLAAADHEFMAGDNLQASGENVGRGIPRGDGSRSAARLAIYEAPGLEVKRRRMLSEESGDPSIVGSVSR